MKANLNGITDLAGSLRGSAAVQWPLKTLRPAADAAWDRLGGTRKTTRRAISRGVGRLSDHLPAGRLFGRRKKGIFARALDVFRRLPGPARKLVVAGGLSALRGITVGRLLTAGALAGAGWFGWQVARRRGNLLMGPAEQVHGHQETVEHVDLHRYLGSWYEIARVPTIWEANLVGVKATYSLKDDGTIKVVNRGRKDSLSGSVEHVEGTAWVVDERTNAKLKVQFNFPVPANYWIVDLDPDYRYAAVACPEDEKLWILSRTPQMDPKTYDKVLHRVAQKGYDVARLEKTLQPVTWQGA